MKRSIQEEILLTLWLIVWMLSYTFKFWIIFGVALPMSFSAAFGMIYFASPSRRD